MSNFETTSLSTQTVFAVAVFRCISLVSLLIDLGGIINLYWIQLRLETYWSIDGIFGLMGPSF